MIAVGAVSAVLVRTLRSSLRRRNHLAFSLVQPVIWVVFFGALFRRYDVSDTAAGVNYLSFITPGLCAMTVLFAASQVGATVLRDLQTGFLERMLQTSASGGDILLGKLGGDVLRATLQAFLVFGCALLFGAALPTRPLAILPALAALIVFAWGYGCASLWVALRTRSQEGVGLFVQVFNMPLLFSSTALMPIRHLPPWLAWLANANPLSVIADLGRMAYGAPAPSFRTGWVVLAGGLLLHPLVARALQRAALVRDRPFRASGGCGRAAGTG